MHYYQHHIGDFIRDTSRLTDTQCMAYLRLIWIYYETEEPLTDDVDLLAFKTGCDTETIKMLLQCYFHANALRWHHNRIDSELDRYKSKSEKAAKSAKVRWNNANAMRTHSEGNANQEPRTNNQQPIKKARRNFVPPTVEEVKQYCLERGNNIDADNFVNHYKANGWMRGKNKIKDWKACVITWEKRDEKDKPARKLSLGERATEHRKRAERIIAKQEADDKSMGEDDAHIRPPLDIGIR